MDSMQEAVQQSSQRPSFMQPHKPKRKKQLPDIRSSRLAKSEGSEERSRPVSGNLQLAALGAASCMATLHCPITQFQARGNEAANSIAGNRKSREGNNKGLVAFVAWLGVHRCS
jgi:hypothetical protein